MPAKHILATRYTRLKNGLATHQKDMPVELVTLLDLPQLYTLGDQFVAHYATEAAARGTVGALHSARMLAEAELDAVYRRCKNLTEAFVGEKNSAALAQFVKTGTLLERAIYLRNGLRGDSAVIAQVGESNLEDLEREIGQYQDAEAAENSTASALTGADTQTDTLNSPLARRVNAVVWYVKAWLYAADKLHLLAEFVEPRAVRKSAAVALQTV